MPGKKHRFTLKQHRMAKHIMESELKRGLSKEIAERIAWATVQEYRNRLARKRPGGKFG